VLMLNGRKQFAVVVAAAAAALTVLRIFDPASSSFFPPCPLRYFTGWYCPGCGSLRALHQLLHGNLHAAWAMNPLTITLLPFLAYGFASLAVFELRGRPLPGTLPAAWIRTLCAVIVLFGIVRNLPLWPFHLLAPGSMLHL
jgi:Protein of unknown function (DUF2752)